MRIALTILLLGTICFGQNELVIRSFVKSDTIQLRWAPMNYDDFALGLRNGYEIDRTESSGTIKTYLIPRLTERTDKSELTDRQKEIEELLRSISESSPDESGPKETVFAMLLLSAGPDKSLARLCGLYFEDIDYEKGKVYQYSVRIKGSDDVSGRVEVHTEENDINGPMSELKGYEPYKRTAVYLDWEAKGIDYDYSGFWIEKSLDGKLFKAMNDLPHIFLRSQNESEKTRSDYLDSLVEEGNTYYYRIRGINHFGDLGELSNEVQVYIPRFLKGECRIDTVRADKNMRRIEGRFLFNNDGDIGNLKEFILFRSDSMFFGFEAVARLEPDRNNFLFEYQSALYSGDRNYFKVAAISQDDDTSYSYPYYFFTLDQEPPTVPTGLEGMVNNSGKVVLRWNKNPESDIRGYRIFMANALHEEFMEVTKVFEEDTVFPDSLGLYNLTSEVYFRMAAVDMNYNNSDFSEIVKLDKPDTIPPVPCVFKSYHQEKNGIGLKWINSSSGDAVKNVLLRSDKNEMLTPIAEWTKDSIRRWIDSVGVDPGQLIYEIHTFDEQDNLGKSELLTVQFEPGYRAGIDSLSAKVNREDKVVELKWSQVKPGEIYSVQIYRKKSEGKFRLIKTLRKEFESGYLDKDLSINNRYIYKVKLVYKTGHSSKMDNLVEVMY
jgi:uncharacterized protein